jgi:hypothetical protein
MRPIVRIIVVLLVLALWSLVFGFGDGTERRSAESHPRVLTTTSNAGPSTTVMGIMLPTGSRTPCVETTCPSPDR